MVNTAGGGGGCVKLLLDRQVGVERFAEKNLTVRFSTHGSARARTAVHFLLDRNTIHNIYDILSLLQHFQLIFTIQGKKNYS